MSTHGRSGLSRWLFGSVTQKVLAAKLLPGLRHPGEGAGRDEIVEAVKKTQPIPI